MTPSRRQTGTALLITAALLSAPAVTATPAFAKDGGQTVEARGACIGGGAWHLKAKHDDARIEVEYEVDTNRPGQVWRVMLTDNNARIFAGNRRTAAPSGAFTVRLLAADRPGIDTIRAHATLGSRSCGGVVRL